MAKRNKKNDKAFSSIDLVCQCLIDEEKTDSFGKILRRYVKKEHIVLDIGTGSGILALLAARAGAKKVYAVEFDDYVADVARENIKTNKYDKIISVITDDARTVQYKRGTHFDVVVMEMLTTGMVDEFQVQAINNLHKQKVIDRNTILLPKKQETYITPAYTDFKNCGLNIKMVRHLWKHDKNDGLVTPLSKPVLLSCVDFSSIINEYFCTQVSITIKSGGLLNSLYLTSHTIVDDDTVLASTNSLNASVAVPLPERKVKKGDIFKLEIKYRFGYGYGQFNVNYVD